MRYHKGILVALACAGLGGCANPDSVLFVTDTSLGINVESKPPTVSVAYDRIEGYIAPRYDNGALPPVVASIQTGGNVFNPTIRQVYATGQAAVRAVGGDAPASNPALTGGRRLAFFGTATTVGFKAGFDTGAAVPDSLLFGYRRMEFSFIPLGTDSKTGSDTYASALASVDSNTSTTGTGGVSGANGVGLTHSQFIATGLAADVLATNPAIRKSFQTIGADSVASSLSPTERAAAVAQGTVDATNNQTNLDKVMAKIAPNGQLDPVALKTLIDSVNGGTPGAISSGTVTTLESLTTAAAVRTQLNENQYVVGKLAAAS